MDFSPESGSGGAPSSTYSVEPAEFGVQAWDAPMVLPQTLTVGYYRQKVIEFQNLLINLQNAREGMIGLVDYGPDEIRPELTALLDELDSKIGRYRQVAELLNLGINGINKVGAGFPKLTIPNGLGIAPAAVAAGIGAAIAVAASLIVWGNTWIRNANALARQAQLYGYLTPEQRAAIAESTLKIEGAAKASESSPLTSVANITKWVAIAAVAYFAYQAYQKMR
jgi:hypothetical protein